MIIKVSKINIFELELARKLFVEREWSTEIVGETLVEIVVEFTVVSFSIAGVVGINSLKVNFTQMIS